VPENFAARAPGVDAGGAGGSATRAKPLLGFARVFFAARECASMARALTRSHTQAVRPATPAGPPAQSLLGF